MAIPNFIEQIKSWPMAKKAVFASVLIISLASAILLFLWMQMPDYQILFANLSQEDAGAVIEKLKAMRVPYKCSPAGITVPSDKVYDLRLQLASQGLPQGGIIGYEVFDRSSFGATDFIQKVNYRRALQGELARTIKSLSAISDCRVHLTIPEKSIFSTDAEKPRASVLVRLEPGRTLTRQQVNGIVHLVAGSVEGLDTGDVVLVNQKGEALTGNNDPSIMLSSSQLEYQRHLEKDMETRISEILEPVVGAGKVKVRANAAVDFTRTEKTEELYDPDSQVVRSEQREVEQNGLSAPSGVPGVSSNLPTGKGYSGTTASSVMSRKKETINYEISKVVNHVVQPTGVLKRMTIAVIVDGTYEKATGSGEAAYKPRSADELAKYEALAKRAMGFSEARGDEVKVINMPFESIGQEELPRPKVEIVPVVVGTAKYFLPFLAVLLLFIFVVKPLLKVLSSAPAARQPQLTLSQQAIAELEKMKELSGASSKDSLIEWAKQNPKEAASLVRGWIEEA